MNSQKEMMRKLARLEFENDQLKGELLYVDRLLRKIGFTAGMQSLKAAAEEVLQLQQES